MHAPHAPISAHVMHRTLPNGLRLLVKENHSAPVTALYAQVQAGYFHEQDRWNGIAHVIEHMMFKGTPRRPEREQIARDVRDLGGMINAGTYYEETSYYIVVPSQHTRAAMDILTDILRNSLFEAEELAREIEVIVQESLQKRDNPGAMLTESLYELAFDRHRIRRWRIGHPETLRALTRDDLVQFWEQTYRPQNIVLAVVGDVQSAKIVDWTQEFWGDMPVGAFQRDDSPEEPPRAGFRYRRLTGETRQRLFQILLPAPDLLHADAPALTVLTQVLSDGRSARFYRRLKEEQRLVNSAWASYESFDKMGILTFGAECVHDDPTETEQALWAEVNSLCHHPVGREDLERVKTRIQSRRLYAQEEVLGVARTLASYEALGDYRLVDTLLERLHEVTTDDVRRVAQDYLSLERGALLEYLPPEPPLRERTAKEIETDLRAAVTEPVEPARTERRCAPARLDPIQPIALPGGGTLLFRPRHDLPLIAIYALFRGGRRRENRATSGLTNLMLKASLKGTKRCAAEEIANRIEGLGSSIGTSLLPDYFGYGIKLQRPVLREGFALFAETLMQPAFPEEEVEREKQAIYADIRRQQDSNFAVAYDLFTAACYGEDHPYGLSASGIVEAVEPLTSESLRAWHAAHLHPENLYIGMVGDLSEAEAIELCGQLQLPAPTAAPEDFFAPLPAQAAPSERAVERPKQQTAMVIGFPGANLHNDDRFALDVLAEITSSMAGRFFRTVRGENALAYQVTGFHRARQDFGNFVAYTATSPENEARARELLLKECSLLSRELVSEEELQAAKTSIEGNYAVGMQTYSAQAAELASCAVYGLPSDNAQRYLARIQNVTKEEVRAVAAHYLDRNRCWYGVARGGA
jgi:zinc protease